MMPISEALEMLLRRQGLLAAPAGTGKASGKKDASSQTTALSAMGWANAYLDWEEEEIKAGRSPTGGEEDRRFENSGKEPAAEATGQVNRDGGPTLRLVHTSSRRRPVRYVAGPRLVLIWGGKS